MKATDKSFDEIKLIASLLGDVGKPLLCRSCSGTGTRTLFLGFGTCSECVGMGCIGISRTLARALGISYYSLHVERVVKYEVDDIYLEG